MPSVNIYTKEQVDTLLAGAGGVTRTTITSVSDFLTWVANCKIGDELIFDTIRQDSNNNITIGNFFVKSRSTNYIECACTMEYAYISGNFRRVTLNSARIDLTTGAISCAYHTTIDSITSFSITPSSFTSTTGINFN